MTLEVRCRDMGFDCDGVVHSETQEDLLQQVAAHAKSVHGVTEITEEIVTQVKSVIREVK